MKPVIVPAALTVFAATIVTVAFLPDQPVRVPVDIGDIELAPAPTANAQAILASSLDADRTTAFEGTLTVVGIEGPSVFQMDVASGMDGSRTVDSGSWLFGRDGDSAWAASDQGKWHEQGAAAAPRIDVAELQDKYQIAVAGRRSLPTGEAWLLVVSERASGVDREWLSVDVASGLLVRRETFDDDGVAVRLVAFETLRTTGRLTPTFAVTGQPPAPRIPAPTAWNGIEISELPGQYRLVGFTHHDDGDMPPVALLFTDGLYRLSVYPIVGALNPGDLEGAVHEQRDGFDLYRWPGAEPQRLVWSGDGHTFTAITDAPLDAVLPALGRFPRDPELGTLSRMRRGLERVADSLWPFD